MPKQFMLVFGLGVFLAGCVTLGNPGENAIIRAKDTVAPALVHVRPVKEVFSSGKREEVPTVGSGFIISPDGFVVTNEHVAGESRFVRCVLYNKDEVEAKVVGTDPYTDIAVLKLDAKRSKLPCAKLGRSASLKAGQTVLALGSPHGLARSVSAGIVSVTDRYLEERGEEPISPYNNWIQTDAAINPGNSGGPLVNLKGEVVGVNARMLFGAENVGFAIPIDTAKEVIDALIANGRVSRSWIGESLQPMTAMTDDALQKGVLVADMDPLSPGYEAGLRPGDVMVAVNGTPVNARFEEDLPPVRKRIADLPVGESAQVRVRRGGQDIDIPVTPVEKSQMRGDQAEFPEWGFTAVELTADIVRRAQLPAKQGILVSGAQVGGIAANAQIKGGDIVLEVDNEAVRDLAHFKSLYDKLVASKKRLILLRVRNGALARFALVKQDATTPPTVEPDAGQPSIEGDPDHVE